MTPEMPVGGEPRSLPTHPATARGLIQDLTGRWLTVRRVGDDWWHLPGGLIEQDESPSDACRREIREELGIDLYPGPLHCLAWNPPHPPNHHARFSFLFDMGIYDAAVLSRKIHLSSIELDTWQWTPVAQALSLVHPHIAARLSLTLSTPPTAVYTEHQ